MLSKVQQRKIAHLFDVLDTNRNGLLQLDDFVAVSDHIVSLMQWERDSRKARTLLNKASRLFIQLVIDTGEMSMGISKAKWLAFFERELNKNDRKGPLHHYVHRTTHHLFSLFDLNGDKFISKEEYANMLGAYNLSHAESETSFELLDQNGDGRISEAELIDGLHDFFWSSDHEAAGNFIFGKWQ